MPPTPPTWPPDGRRARRPDGHRPALSGRLRRRQPPPDLGQRRQARQAAKSPPSTGTPTPTTTVASTSTRASSPRPWPRPSASARRLPVVRHDAHRARLTAWRANGLLAHQVLIWHKSRSVLGRCDFMWDYEPLPCTAGSQANGRRPSAARRPTPAAVWEVASAIEDGAGRHPSHHEAGRAHPPADRLAHPARRADLRALRRLGHGPHRRRDDRAALLRHRALAGLLRCDRDVSVGLPAPRRCVMARSTGRGRPPHRGHRAAGHRRPLLPRDPRLDAGQDAVGVTDLRGATETLQGPSQTVMRA